MDSMKRKILRQLGWFLCIAGVFVATLRGEDVPAIGAVSTSGTPSDYVLQPADVIRVIVFQEPDLQRDVRITQEGTINLPLIGHVDLRGKSVRQAEELIQRLYDKDYLVNPQITVNVLQYTPRTVQVLGAVNNPGDVAFTPEQRMNLLEAVARAGGFSRLADRRKLRLTRTNAEGKSDNFLINADELIRGRATSAWPLQKGDVIYVPERLF
jgi:polysaccharide export outer membrane protein